MPVTYVKQYRLERLKLAINALQEKHGIPLPFAQVEALAKEFSVSTNWVRRTERRTDIDTAEYLTQSGKMKRMGMDIDQVAGKKIAIGGKATAVSKKKAIRERLNGLLDSHGDIDLPAIAVEFDLHERSTWLRIIFSELQKERAKGKKGEKVPVSREQRELVMDMLRYLGADFGLPSDKTRHREAVDALLDRFSMAQIHKAIKNLYHLQRTAKALRTSFGCKVVKPLLDAIDFSLFRQY